jgi:hypothetical protein
VISRRSLLAGAALALAPRLALPAPPSALTRLGARTWRLRGADAAALGDTQPIAAVNLSPEDAAAQSGAGNRPVYRTLAGRHAVRFTASLSQYLVSAGAPVDPKRGLAVVALMDVRTSGRLFSFASSDTAEATAALAFQPTDGLVTASGVGAFLSGLTDYTPGVSYR